MKKKLLSITFWACISLSSFAQTNLVPNPSFEDYSTCPNFSGQLNYVDSWNNVNLIYGNFSYGTPDFYHTCSASNYASLPNNMLGTLNAFDGNAVVGLVIYNYDIVDYREYASAQLLQPINRETTYNVKFRLTGGSNQQYRFHSHNFGIVFSQSPLSQSGYSIINEVAQIELDTMINTDDWAEYNFTYTPDKEYDYITLGSFKHDTDINPIFNTSSVNKYSNVYIDNIEISEVKSASLKNNQVSKISLTCQNKKIIISNPESELIKTITIVDLQGKVIQSETFSSRNINSFEIVNSLNCGIYLATIVTNNSTITQKFVSLK